MGQIGVLREIGNVTRANVWDIFTTCAYLPQTRHPIDPGKLTSKMWAEFIECEFGSIQVKLDTGAEVNVMPKRLLDKLLHRNYVLKPTPIVLEVYGGALLRPLGTFTLHKCTLNNIELDLEFLVADVESVPLLSLEAIEQYGLINRVKDRSVKIISSICKVAIHACKTATVTLPSLPVTNITSQINVISSKKVTFADNQSSELAIKEIIKNNPEVFSTEVGSFPSLYSLEVDESKRPVAVPSRRVPHAIKDRYRKYLSQLCDQKVIKKCDNHKGYISPVVLVEKPDKSLRVCLDPKNLNEALYRPFYEIPTKEDISMFLTNKKYFSVLDLTAGFWHCKLDESSSELCKFSTPFGIYQFLRLPFGLSVSPEIFQKAVNDLFGDIEGVVLYFDDMLIVANTEEDHDRIFLKVIERAKQNNVHFNPNKIQFKRRSVKFLGHIYSESGKTIDPERVEAITSLKSPQNVKELQRLLGIINHVREFVPNLADETSCLTQLIRKNVHFQWLPFHTEALDRIKAKIVNAVSLVVFDPTQPTEIQCDASKDGLGSCLSQNGRPIAFVSRSLTKAEKNYAQIEKELLAIVFSVQKFHYYIYGQKAITVYTDHKPLVPIFKQQLSEVSSKRITRLLLKTISYDLRVQYLPGKLMFVADALSRDYLPCNPNDEVLITQVHAVSSVVANNVECIYAKATTNDQVLQQVIHFNKEGWPDNSKSMSKELKHFFRLRSEITVDDNLVYYRDRLVIPKSLQHSMLKRLHSGHLGMSKCKAYAHQTIYWPGLNVDIESFISKCSICATFAPSQKRSEMFESNLPDLPYEQVSADILEYNGHFYLVVIDSYSKWLDALKLPDKTSKSVIDAFQFLFSIHGIPRILMVDNNPFKSNQCIEFSKQLNFKIVSCSPHFHQSNGLAEKAVSIVKQFLKKCSKDPQATLQNCLLQYRVTPIAGLDASPAQLLMSRQLNTTIPIHSSKLIPSLVPNIKDKLKAKSLLSKQNYDPKSPRKEVEYSPSDYVFMQNPITKNWEPGMIVECCEEPRSYLVQNEGTNRVVRRNEIFLKPNRSAVNFKPATPVYMLPCTNSVLTQQIPDPIVEPINDNLDVQNNDVQNNDVQNDQQLQINNHQIDLNLAQWRQQIRNRIQQNVNEPVNRTRTRTVKKPDRLNL